MHAMKRILVVLFGLCLSHAAFAMQSVDPYQLTVPASGQLSQDQQSAFKLLIERLTGDDKALDNQAIADALSHAGEYLQQYSYQNSQAHQQLLATFNRSQIETLLTQAGIAFWAQVRPTILVWYASEQQNQRQIDADGSASATALQQQAKNLALPMIFPIMDLDDSMAVSVSDVWGEFNQPIIKASRRYGADIALTVKSYLDNGATHLSWQLLDVHQGQLINSGDLRDDNSTDNAANLTSQMLKQIASQLAARYAVVRSVNSDSQIILSFAHIDNFTQYQHLYKFLMNQPSVGQVNLQQVSAGQYQFEVHLVGPWQSLQSALELDDNYTPIVGVPYHYDVQ
ncbi:DUF2066 domain-containing protein [Celerinatantimonas sp. MCCC 1A17872]|uniref:DUF2066 domain-containing protein n=1 Tax=Celerinatantimonas sp. MCCC 1A17872 TaxID=3177514 RepID=UPI0038C19E8E